MTWSEISTWASLPSANQVDVSAALTDCGRRNGAALARAWLSAEHPHVVFHTGLWAPFHLKTEIFPNNVKMKTKLENQGSHFSCAHALPTECCACGFKTDV